jgi:PAS domain S-box-containing protein
MDNGKFRPKPVRSGSELCSANGTAQAPVYAVVILDRAACVLEWNDEAERLFGYMAEAAIGKPFYHFLDLESLTPGSVEWELLTAYYRGASTCDRQYAHSDGSHFRASAEITPLWDGEFLGYRLTFNSVKRSDEWLE